MRYNRSMELSRIEKILADDCLLDKQRPSVVGVSGGPDSLCLLHLMHRLGYPVIVAHVNHQLRSESDREEIKVKQFAESLGLPFVSHKVDVEGLSKKSKLSVEEAARILRYRFLFQIAHESQAQALAVAHNADDQVETVLMHLLRGAGTAGVRGMSYRSFLPTFSTLIPVVRPLLGVWRAEIETYCQCEGLDPSIDQTNSDLKYFRNRIRSELVPLLGTYNAQAKEHILQMSLLAGEEDALLQELTEQAWEQTVKVRHKDYLVLRLAELRDQPTAIQRRLLRKGLNHLRSDLRDIGLKVIDHCLMFIAENSTNGEWQLLDDLGISKLSADELMIYQGQPKFDNLWPQVPEGNHITLVVPGLTLLGSVWQIGTEIILTDGLNPRERSDDECWFDLDQLQGGLSLRTQTAGERIQPFGRQEFSQKLSDLFINRKVPHQARRKWPILYCGEALLWVVGIQRAKLAPVTQETKRALNVKLIRLG